MSAFAAFNAKKAVAEPLQIEKLDSLLEDPVTASNVVLSAANSLFTPDSVYIGLQTGQYLIPRGAFSVQVLRGTCLLNNVQRIPRGRSFPAVTSTTDSLPTLAATKPNPQDNEPEDTKILADYVTVLRIKNLNLGLENLRSYSPSLKASYHVPNSEYTFEILRPDQDASTVFFDRFASRAIERVSDQTEVLAVYGVVNGGKTTFAKACINNIIFAGSAAAYLDLDPVSSNAAVPDCVSLQFFKEPILGSSVPCVSEMDSSLEMHCYYGLFSYNEAPSYYTKLCQKLIYHYKQNIKPRNIPLVVKYPSWIKGHGRDILLDLHSELRPTKQVYLTHRNAVELEGFEQDTFESTDNPDSDVLSEFAGEFLVLRAVRKEMNTPKDDFLTRNKLLHFHSQKDTLGMQTTFDFERPLLLKSPSKLQLSAFSAVCVLNHDSIPRADIRSALEATVTAVCSTSATVSGITKIPDISGPKFLEPAFFTSLEVDLLGLCIIHSVDAGNDTINVYSNDPEKLYKKISAARSAGHSLVLARGTGSLPAVEFGAHLFPGFQTPYVTTVSRKKIGGVWKARSIARKSQK